MFQAVEDFKLKISDIEVVDFWDNGHEMKINGMYCDVFLVSGEIVVFYTEAYCGYRRKKLYFADMIEFADFLNDNSCYYLGEYYRR